MRKYLVLIVVLMSFETVCWGHDLRSALFHHMFRKIPEWTSKPPKIDEKLRAQIRDEVLLCIGATNRETAADFDKRFQAAEDLKKHELSESELKLLYDFLAGTTGGRDPLWTEETDLIKSHICFSLVWPENGKPANGLGQKLMEMIDSRKLNLEWRKYCVDELGNYYSAKWEDDPRRFDDPERKVIEDFFWEITKDKTFGEKALQRISRLSRLFPEFKKLSDQNQQKPIGEIAP